MELIDKAAAVTIANSAADVHPYEAWGGPETSSEYNEGWNNACDYIEARLAVLEVVEKPAPVSWAAGQEQERERTETT